MSQHQVKCECGSLFGIEQPDGSLAIKYRDLFRLVKGSVSGPCRKCGATVEWHESLPSQWHTNVRWTGWTVPNSAVPSLPPSSYICSCACTRCVSGECCMVPA